MATSTFEQVMHKAVLDALENEVLIITEEEIEKTKINIEKRLRDSIAKIVLRTQQGNE